MKKLIFNRKMALIVGYHTGNNLNGWEAALDIVLGWRPHAFVAVVGWGYDDRIPLRPWPQFWRHSLTPMGHRSSGIALLGFFTTIGAQ